MVTNKIVNKRDAKEFAKEIINILRDEKRYREMSQECIESIKRMVKDTSHDKLVKLWDCLLKEI